MLSGDSLYDKPKERNKQPLENPYSVLDAPSEQPTVIKEAYDVPKDNDDPEHVYFTADDNGGHSNDSNAYIYDEQNEAAVRASDPHDGYLLPPPTIPLKPHSTPAMIPPNPRPPPMIPPNPRPPPMIPPRPHPSPTTRPTPPIPTSRPRVTSPMIPYNACPSPMIPPRPRPPPMIPPRSRPPLMIPPRTRPSSINSPMQLNITHL